MARTPLSFVSIGKPGYAWSHEHIYEEFLVSLRGTNGVKKFREMRDNDPIIGACMHAITQILREARWDAQNSKGGKEEDTEFLRDNMRNMDRSWGEFISDILSCLTYGWSLFETVYMRRDDMKICWKKFGFRSQSSFDGWDLDDNGVLQGYYQRPAPNYKRYHIPRSRLLHFTTESNGENPEGRSILRNAFRPWYFKKGIEELEAIGIERDLTGMPHFTPPEGFDLGSDDPDTKNIVSAVKNLITNIRRDEMDGLITPFGWEFKLVGSPGTRTMNTTEVINRYNKEIAVTVLAQFIMLGMERTGSYALAKEQTDMFYICLEGWYDAIATTINRIAVPRLFALNGVIDRPLPMVVHTPIHKYGLKDLATYISTLAGGELQALEIDEDVKKLLKRYARLSEFSEVRL